MVLTQPSLSSSDRCTRLVAEKWVGVFSHNLPSSCIFYIGISYKIVNDSLKKLWKIYPSRALKSMWL